MRRWEILIATIIVAIIVFARLYFWFFLQHFAWNSIHPKKIAVYEGLSPEFAQQARRGISLAGKLIAMAKPRGIIDMKNIERPKILHPFTSLKKSIVTLAFSKSGKYLGVTDGNVIKVYTTLPWTVAAQLDSGSGIGFLLFTDDDKLMITVTATGRQHHIV